MEICVFHSDRVCKLLTYTFDCLLEKLFWLAHGFLKFNTPRATLIFLPHLKGTIHHRFRLNQVLPRTSLQSWIFICSPQYSQKKNRKPQVIHSEQYCWKTFHRFLSLVFICSIVILDPKFTVLRPQPGFHGLSSLGLASCVPLTSPYP